MEKYFNKVEMTAISELLLLNHEYNVGDRVILEYNDGEILINNGIATEKSLHIDEDIEEQIDQIEEYYQAFNVPLEAIITRVEPYKESCCSAGGGFINCIRLYMMVYFPSHRDGHLLPWKCDSCGTENEAIYCRHCGKRRTLPIDYWICPKCNKQINIEDSFCGMCGTAKPCQYKTKTTEINDIPAKKESDNMYVEDKPNLHTVANSITKGKNSRLCTELFNEAIELKRNGDIELAIRKEIEAIKLYPDSPDLTQMFMSLGKLYYLERSYKKAQRVYALSIYRTFNNPSNIINGKPSPTYQLSAIHYGHALKDIFRQNSSIKNYEDAIMGRKVNMSELDDYDKMCIEHGINYVCDLYEKYRNGYAEREYDYFYSDIIGYDE